MILDFGGQYTQLIARRIRECGVYSEIHPWEIEEDAIRKSAPCGVNLSGGPESVNQDDQAQVGKVVCELGGNGLGEW